MSLKQETKRRVYIVFADTNYSDHQFRDVFFTEEAAKKYAAGFPSDKNCVIETYEEREDGGGEEIH